MSDTATIKLLPKQSEAWNAWESPLITELGYGGAAGGGKTRLGWYLVITNAEMYPGCRVAVGRKELKNFKITTLKELWAIFIELEYEADRDYIYKEQEGMIKFSNGSEVQLLDTAYSPQDPEYTRLGGLPLTWAWLDESNETPEKAKSILKTRVGRLNKFYKGKCVSSVPDGATNFIDIKPFWLETFNPNKGHVHRDYYKPWKDGTMPSYRQFIRALPGDNKHLPEAYIENLKRADNTTKQRLLYGNFEYDSDPNRIMNYEAILDLKTNSLQEDRTKYLINDIARFGGDKIVLGEFEGLYLVGLGVYKYQDVEETMRLAKEQASDSRIPFSQILSDEDGVGGGFVDGMKGTKGFMGNSRPLEIWDTLRGKLISANFTNLRSQCYFKLSELVNSHQMAIRLRYFKTNIEGYTQEQAISDLEEELDQIKQADSSGQNTKLAVIPKDLMKEQLGRSPDFADILMMRMLFEIKKNISQLASIPRQNWSNEPKKNKAR